MKRWENKSQSEEILYILCSPLSETTFLYNPFVQLPCIKHRSGILRFDKIRPPWGSRDQYIEPPTASVLGGVYLKSAPVKKWEDTDILIKIKTATGALLFLSTPWPRLSFFLVRSELQSACQSHFHASTQRSSARNNTSEPGLKLEMNVGVGV